MTGKRLTAGIALLAALCMAPPTALALTAKDLKNRPVTDIATGPAYVDGNVLVLMKQGGSAARLQSDLDALSTPRGYALKTFRADRDKKVVIVKSPGVDTRKLMAALKKNPAVKSVSPDYIIDINSLPDDPAFDRLWALDNQGQAVNEITGSADADIDAPEAWEGMAGDEPMVVAAVIDTGIDYGHGDLAPNMWTNGPELNGEPGVDDDNNGYVDDIYGIDTANKDGDPYDDNKHGTHVAGTIAGVADNGAGITGVSRNTAKVMALKFLAANGRGATSDAIECIYYIIDMNKRPENDIVVINASWGSLSTTDAMEAAIEDAYKAGIVLSAAAGNDAMDCEGHSKHYPSSVDKPNVISVAASDQNDNLADFSNYGASEADIAAPGVNILSAVPGGGYVPAYTDIFFDGMEDGKGLWDMEKSVGIWDITTEKAYQKDKAWSDSPNADYEQGPWGVPRHYALVSKPIDLSGATNPLMLGFWLYKDLNPKTAACGKKDELLVEVSGDDGATWEILCSFAKSDPAWKVYSYLIPHTLYTDKFRVRFHMVIVPTGEADGIYLDNIGIGEANALGAFQYLKGTSMAAPHVSGAVCLAAAMYPNETADKRISRILAGADVLPALKGVVSTDARLNLAGATDLLAPDMPVITGFEKISGRKLNIKGHFFKDSPGKVWFHDAIDSEHGVAGEILSWSDTRINVNKPPFSGGYFQIIDANGVKSTRKQFKLSLWGKKSNSDTKRDSLTAQYIDGTIYTFGGFAGGNNSLRSWEIYDVANDTWEYQYGKWMPYFASHMTSAILGGKIYLMGGYDSHGDGITLDKVTLFDPETKAFEAKEPYPVPACFMRAAAVGDKIYVTGGLDVNDMPMNKIMTYDPQRPAGQRWATLGTRMSCARAAHGAVALGQKLYIFGGVDSLEDENIYLKSGEILDTATGTMTPMAPMPVSLARFGACTDGRYIYAVGGTNNAFWRTPKDIVLRYDPIKNEWTSLPDRLLAVPKLASPALFIPGKGIYSLNGGFINTENPPGMMGYPFESTDRTAVLGMDMITDADGDAIPDGEDNCRLTPNRAQLDADGDGYGNLCDCDLNNDNRVDRGDFKTFRSLWGSTRAIADFNLDGKVDRADYKIFRSRWGSRAPFE